MARTLTLEKTQKTLAPVTDRARLESQLRETYPDAPVMRCTKCDLIAPDVPEISECPGCQAGFQAGKKEQPMTQVANVRRIRPGSSASIGENAPTGEALERNTAKTKADLIELEARIDKAKANKVAADHEIGTVLRQIVDRELWRSSGDYASFVEYAQARFDIGRDMANAYLRIATTFTADEAKGLSVTQLWLLARVKEDAERKQLVDQVKAGKLETTRQLADAVKTKRAKAGLKTERGGFEGTVVVNARVKTGSPVAEGITRATKTGCMFTFELGGQTFKATVKDKAFKVELVPADEE